MNRFVRHYLLGSVLATAAALPVDPSHAQVAEIPDRGTLTQSMGQPQRWKAHIGVLAAWERRGVDEELGGEFIGGLYRDLFNPSVAPLGLLGEGYWRAIAGEHDGGFRLMAWSKFLGLQAGADYSIETSDVDFLLSTTLAVRRGGLFHRGDNVRIDWYPGRNHSFNFGLMVPFRQRSMGRTRPYQDDVNLPRQDFDHDSSYTPGFELQETLERIAHSSDWINRYTTPFFDQDGKDDEKHMNAFLEKLTSFKEHVHVASEWYPQGHTFQAEINRYHEDLVHAFALAIATSPTASDVQKATAISAKAREILLDDVILPYNRLIGQRKQHDSLDPYGVLAQRVFQQWIETSGKVPAPGRPGVSYIFRSLLEALETNRRGSRKIWKDSRLVWIPLHYAVRLDEHDSQAEIDAILERALQTEFTNGNRVHYIINDLFHVELKRMIHAAEDYHVLWIHDYRGHDEAGNPDEVGFRMSIEGYLQALINKVKAYDETWKIPVYVIMLDQFFYEANDGRFWMTFLEDPLNHMPDLPDEYAAWEEVIRSKQEELRQAVADSEILQRGIAKYGRKWAEDKIKVHVNITHPTDLTFRSRHLISGVVIAPDLLMRDHRKISFYDVTELDPSKGEAIYTGMGVGDHYVGATWDDRALLVSGPSLVGLKDAARQMLRSQNIAADKIPQPLQKLPKPLDYEEQVQRLVQQHANTRGLQVHNQPGYGDKKANVVKATLYNLMPQGSHQYIPDSLWNSPLWGGLLVGAALRGGWIFPISPSLKNAPSSGVPQMSRASEVFTRLVMVQNEMRQEIEAAGGFLRVGVYNLNVGVGDVVGKGKIMTTNYQKHPWLRQVIPFHEDTWAFIDSFYSNLHQEDLHADFLDHISEDHRPKLHLKTQFFMTGAVAKHLIPLKEWLPVVRKYASARMVQIRSLSDEQAEELLSLAEDEVADLERAWRESTTQEVRDKSALYLTLGSHNQDFRGTIMDGETLYVVSGGPAMVAYLDFVNILSTTTWVDTVEELDELIPQHSGFWRWVGRHLRNAL